MLSTIKESTNHLMHLVLEEVLRPKPWKRRSSNMSKYDGLQPQHAESGLEKEMRSFLRPAMVCANQLCCRGALLSTSEPAVITPAVAQSQSPYIRDILNSGKESLSTFAMLSIRTTLSTRKGVHSLNIAGPKDLV